MKCVYCNRDITKCRVDFRGLCVKSPQSNGRVKPRTKKEKSHDRDR